MLKAYSTIASLYTYSCTKLSGMSGGAQCSSTAIAGTTGTYMTQCWGDHRSWSYPMTTRMIPLAPGAVEHRQCASGACDLTAGVCL